MRSLVARVGEAMAVGNEGAGVVVAAGDSPEAQALLGRTVGFLGGATYAEYCLASPRMCLPLPEGANAVDAASSFVNPLTALGMVETMRREGHTGLVHTAAASNLGQMLNRICLADGVPLVSIVRRPEQVALLRGLDAMHVCDSSEPTFEADLVAALKITRATLAFDAVGGGQLAGQILNAMEAAIVPPDAPYNRYGSDVHKQVYVYGALDPRPIELHRRFGFSWGVGGWLLTPFLSRTSKEDLARLRQRVADELTTTFASALHGPDLVVRGPGPGGPSALCPPGHRPEVPAATAALTQEERDGADRAARRSDREAEPVSLVPSRGSAGTTPGQRRPGGLPRRSRRPGPG